MNQQNIILIHGRLGQNPDLRYTKNREAVCWLNVAEPVEGQEKPNWHRVIVWGKLAETCSVQLKKGNTVFVRGRNQAREFTSNEGEQKKIVELKAESIGFTYS